MTDLELRRTGMDALSEKLGLVQAERFITLLLREPFDYTEWRKHQYQGATVSSLFAAAKNQWETRQKSSGK